MAAELRSGVPGAIFARLAAEGQRRGRLALEPLALVIERQAKVNLSGYPHRYGTPTPAIPGSGPGLISGTLRRSITHTPVVRTSLGWTTRIGTGKGFYPTYRTGRGLMRGRTPSDRYGEILELLGDRAGHTYPFLEPAFRFGVTVAAPVIYRERYGTGWNRMI